MAAPRIDFQSSKRHSESSARTPVNLVIIHAPRDEQYLVDLKKHIITLQHRGLIQVWSTSEIRPGLEVKKQTREAIDRAHIIAVLVSPDFASEEECWIEQLGPALAQHDAGKVTLIPILVRPMLLKGTRLGDFSSLPYGGHAVSTYADTDAAWKEVTEGLARSLERLPPHVISRESITRPSVSGRNVREIHVYRFLLISLVATLLGILFKSRIATNPLTAPTSSSASSSDSTSTVPSSTSLAAAAMTEPSASASGSTPTPTTNARTSTWNSASADKTSRAPPAEPIVAPAPQPATTATGECSFSVETPSVRCQGRCQAVAPGVAPECCKAAQTQFTQVVPGSRKFVQGCTCELAHKCPEL